LGEARHRPPSAPCLALFDRLVLPDDGDSLLVEQPLDLSETAFGLRPCGEDDAGRDLELVFDLGLDVVPELARSASRCVSQPAVSSRPSLSS